MNAAMTRTRLVAAGLALVAALTVGACSATDPTPSAPTEGSATMEQQGAPHGLPLDDPTAARAELRRRLVAEWNALLADIPTAHINSEFSVGGDEVLTPSLAVQFPSAPESEWDRRDSEVIDALGAHGWTAKRDLNVVTYVKGEYRMIGGCAVDGCWWDMSTAPLPPIVDSTGAEFDLPDLLGRSPEATPRWTAPTPR